jgi:hypothetical protein
MPSAPACARPGGNRRLAPVDRWERFRQAKKPHWSRPQTLSTDCTAIWPASCHWAIGIGRDGQDAASPATPPGLRVRTGRRIRHRSNVGQSSIMDEPAMKRGNALVADEALDSGSCIAGGFSRSTQDPRNRSNRTKVIAKPMDIFQSAPGFSPTQVCQQMTLESGRRCETVKWPQGSKGLA